MPRDRRCPVLPYIQCPCISEKTPERWLTEVLDFCTGSHKLSSFTRRKSHTFNNRVPVLRIPSKYGWMSCSLNESNLTQLRHKLQPCFRRRRNRTAPHRKRVARVDKLSSYAPPLLLLKKCYDRGGYQPLAMHRLNSCLLIIVSLCPAFTGAYFSSSRKELVQSHSPSFGEISHRLLH